MLARDKRLFEEISSKIKHFGCAFEGCVIFHGGRFQTRDFDNKVLQRARSRVAELSVNCGIRGGTSLSASKEYYERVLELMDRTITRPFDYLSNLRG